MTERFPSHVRIAMMRKICESLNGFAMVLGKGDRDSGEILLRIEVGAEPKLYQQFPTLDGGCDWSESAAGNQDVTEKCSRLRQRDPDIWIVEMELPGENERQAFFEGIADL